MSKSLIIWHKFSISQFSISTYQSEFVYVCMYVCYKGGQNLKYTFMSPTDTDVMVYQMVFCTAAKFFVLMPFV